MTNYGPRAPRTRLSLMTDMIIVRWPSCADGTHHVPGLLKACPLRVATSYADLATYLARTVASAPGKAPTQTGSGCRYDEVAVSRQPHRPIRHNKARPPRHPDATR